MSVAVEAIPSSSSASASEVLTLRVLRERYRVRLVLATRLGLREWFIAAFGSEEKWLSQFTKQPSDGDVEI